MTGLEFERRKKPESDINMTPLIDMVFLLLIFFVLSSHFVSHEGFKVKLPKAMYAKTQKNEQMTIFINKEGDIFLNDTKVRLENLTLSIKSGLSTATSKTVVIKADEDVNLGLAVKVMDIAKEANADSLVISTKTINDEKDK
ncbi:MAG: biopolymer transporter ExbD [bacterium]|nr:biopolymer transporter ExbD [bacterium]